MVYNLCGILVVALNCSYFTNILINCEIHRRLQILFTLEDGLVIETVVIPCDRGRNTVCVSSQVGCAMNCQFCYTGRQASLSPPSIHAFYCLLNSDSLSCMLIMHPYNLQDGFNETSDCC